MKTKNAEKKIETAVKNVAESLGGNIKKTESELLSKMLHRDPTPEEKNSISESLSDILKGMKIDRNPVKKDGVSRADTVRKLLQSVKGSKQSEEKSSRQPRQRRPDQRETAM